MTKENIDPERFLDLQLNGHDYEVANDIGHIVPVKFAKLVTVRLANGEEHTIKLSYTRAFPDGTPTDRPVPCVRIDGEKFMLTEDAGVAVAADCIAFVE